MSGQSVDAYLLFGRLAVKFGVLKPDALRQTVEKQAQLIAKGKHFQVGEVAVRLKLMTEAQRDQILKAQSTAPVKQEGSYFGYLALVNGFVKQKQLAEALKKQEAEGKTRMLGKIFKTENPALMTDGQIDGVLRAQERIRKRIARATQGKMAKPDGSSKAAEALAKLAQFEKQFGGMVEVALDSADDVEAPAGAEAAAAPIADAELAEALPLPAPPKDIYATLEEGAIPVVQAAPMEDDDRFADPVPAAGGPVLDLDADAEGGDFGWGAGGDDDVQVEVGPAGASPATTADIQAMPTVDVEVSIEPGGGVSSMPDLTAGVGTAAPSPAGPKSAAATAIAGGGSPSAAAKQARPEGLAAADEGARFKGRRKEQPQERVRAASNSNLKLVIFVLGAAAIFGAYVLSTMLFK